LCTSFGQEAGCLLDHTMTKLSFVQIAPLHNDIANDALITPLNTLSYSLNSITVLFMPMSITVYSCQAVFSSL
jgi:hypothetical protein